MNTMIGAEEALAIILEWIHPLRAVTVSLQRSLGCVLAGHIVADEDVPPFDNAAMDGYAIRAKDVRQTPAVLNIIGDVAAGAIPARRLGPAEAMSISTGAKIPDGCTAVVQHEWTERLDDHQVCIDRAVLENQNIRLAGADIKRGATVLEVGHHIRPQEIGVLASLGRQFIEVYRHPTVAILPTGSEVVEVWEKLGDGKIRNSNAHILAALVRQLDCEPVSIDIARDDEHDLKTKIELGLRSDVLITSGGVSVGSHDLVVDAMNDLGIDIKFHKVNIKPGMPMVFGLKDGKPVFGLPGNPVSSMVTFLKFVKPALMKMKGIQKPGASYRLRAKVENEIRKTDGKQHFIRGILGNRGGALVVRTTGEQTSNLLTSLVKANCLIIVPEETGVVHAGDEVEVELL